MPGSVGGTPGLTTDILLTEYTPDAAQAVLGEDASFFDDTYIDEPTRRETAEAAFDERRRDRQSRGRYVNALVDERIPSRRAWRDAFSIGSGARSSGPKSTAAGTKSASTY